MWHTSSAFHFGVNPRQSLGLPDAWRLWDYKSHNRSVAYMTGAPAVFPLAQVWQTRMAIEGIRSHTIDCAIRFNTYAIAEESLRLEHAPELIHDRITVTRAFTPYQILDAVAELKKGEIVFVFAPAKQFFDGDVAFDEGLFLLQKLVRFFTDAHGRGVALFVVERPSYAAPAFSTFLSDIKPLTHKSRWELHRLQGENSYRLRHYVGGVVNRDILHVPEPVRRIAPALAGPAPAAGQMQFRFT